MIIVFVLGHVTSPVKPTISSFLLWEEKITMIKNIMDTPFEIIKGIIKLLGIWAVLTILDMSILKVLQKPTRYKLPHTNRYKVMRVSKDVNRGTRTAAFGNVSFSQ